MQTVRRNSHEPPPTLLYNANAPPRKRWRSLPPTGPAHVEHTSAVDDDEVGRQIKEAWAGNSDADTALRRLERDLRAVGRSPPTMLTRFVAGRPRRRGKRGPDPAKLHLLRVTVFGLLQELEKRGIAPTQLGAVLVAEELGRQGVRSTPEAVIGIWKTGSRAIRGK